MNSRTIKIHLVFCILTALLAGCGERNKETHSYQAFHFTNEMLNDVAKRATEDKYQNEVASIVALADSILGTTVEIPTRPGVWPHFYVDPEEGKPLVPGKYLGNWQWEHHNQDGTKVYLSDTIKPETNYDGVLILTKVHHGYADAMLAMGFAYKLNPKKEYLRKIEEILSAYADVYEAIPLHDKQMRYNPDSGTGNGRLAAQALGESVWLCKVTQALDMVWGELDPMMKAKTEEGLLRPAVEVIKESALTYHLKIHNIRCWYLAAIGTTGLLLQDADLVNWAISEDEYALAVQLEKGFTEDGLWYERAPSYHYYAINPIIYLVNAAANRGFVNYKTRLKGIIMSYANFAHPNTLEVPRYNDCRSTFLDNAFDIFSYVHAAIGGDDVAALLRKIQENREEKTKVSKKHDPVSNQVQQILNGVLFGKALPKDIAPFEVKSNNYPSSGYAVFNHLKEEKGIFLTVKYDAYEGEGSSMWHQHHDQLSFTLFWGNELVFADPGHAEYGAPAQSGWYRTTLGHNTLTVDLKNQTRKPSTLHQFVTGDKNMVVVGNDSVYQGVSYTRGFVVVNDSTLLVLDRITSEEQHIYDIAMHPKGERLTALQGFKTFPIPEEGNGYNYLKEPKAKTGLKNFSFSTKNQNGNINITYASATPSEMILANGLGPDFEKVPVAIARKEAKSHIGAWLIQCGHQTHNLQADFGKDKTSLTVGEETFTFDAKQHKFLE